MNAHAFREDEEKSAGRNSEDEEMCGPSEEEDLSSFCASTSEEEWTGEDEKGRRRPGLEAKTKGACGEPSEFLSLEKRKEKQVKWSGGAFFPRPRVQPHTLHDGDPVFDRSPRAAGPRATDEVVSFLNPRVAASIADQLEPEIDAVCVSRWARWNRTGAAQAA